MAPSGATLTADDRSFFTGLARAFGGAVFFSLPLLMTMEMWQLGFAMDRLRLVLFMVLIIPVLIGLDHYSGFKDTATWAEDVIDGFVAYGVGFVASAAVLALFHVIGTDTPLEELVGKVALQAIPASFGAVLASSQLAGDGNGQNSREQRRKARAGYAAEIFLMLCGAVFLAFNVAPTEEIILLAYMITPGQAIALGAASLILMHAFVYSVNFKGRPQPPEGMSGWSLFLRYTVVGYATVLLVAAYVLWTFGRFDDTDLVTRVTQTAVLALPGSLGAAAARLIV